MTRGRPAATPLIQQAGRLLEVWPWEEAQHVEGSDFDEGNCGYCGDEWPCEAERWRIAAEPYLNTPTKGAP